MYCNLVKEVREAFEACELVRVNCTGLNKSDCRKIGAKLKDLVPCILLSFEDEHILMWRGKDRKSSLPQVEDDHTESEEVIASDPTNSSSSIDDKLLNDQDILISVTGKSLNEELSVEVSTESTLDDNVGINQTEDPLNLKNLCIPVLAHVDPTKKTGKALDFSTETHQESSIISDQGAPAAGAGNSSVDSCLGIPCRSIFLDTSLNTIEKGKDLYLPGREAQPLAVSYEGCDRHEDIGAATSLDDGILDSNKLEMREADGPICQDNMSSSRACLEGVMLLLRLAVESGRAIILDDHSLDANIVFERSVALAKTALPGPVFQHRVRKTAVRRTQKDKDDEIEQDTEVEAVLVSEKRCSERNNSQSQRKDDFPEVLSDVVPHGSLRVDELAKLLA